MVGKTYQYGGNIHYVISVTPNDDEEKFTIKTNRQEYHRKYEAGTDFLSHWQETSTVSQAAVPAVAVMEKENTMVDKLTDLLMDNIEKVQSNPEYIKQAQAINNNVNSIINLTKLKLDVMKYSKVKR